MFGGAVSGAREWVTSHIAGGRRCFSTFWERKEPHWCESPTKFYKHCLAKKQIQTKLDVESLYNNLTHNPDTKVRFVCTSDTHNQTDKYTFDIPDGDVLLHAGDFTQTGDSKQVYHFADWLDSLPHPIKIVISGNHELSFDPVTAHSTRLHTSDTSVTRDSMIARLCESCTYLEDSSAVVYGIRIFGSPWQPEFHNWAYNLQRGEECRAKWREIPTETDFLITHGPPVGHGDLCRDGIRAGCVDLLEEVQCRIKPEFHLFGHIHEDWGVTTDGQTVYMNASMCNLRYRSVQPPIVVDMDRISDELVLDSAPPSWNLSDPRNKTKSSDH